MMMMDEDRTVEEQTHGIYGAEVDTLNVSQSTIRRLRDHGYQSFEDFKGQTPLSLSKECTISQKDAVNVLQQVNGQRSQPPATLKSLSALDLFQKQKDRKSIFSFCKEVDDLLGGGVPLGQTSEICGVPGAGKTQLSLQLAVNVQIPEIFGGCNGECLYIDTEGSFLIERLEQIAASFVKHIHKMAPQKRAGEDLSDTEKRNVAQGITLQSVLSNIRYFRLYSLIEQLAFVQILENYIKSRNIKLIIFDSITFHFRHDQQGYGDLIQRNRLLQAMGQKMSQLANDYEIAVVYLNQVTTRSDKNDSGHSTLVPALGMTWSNACCNHFFLEFDYKTGERYFKVNKGINMTPGRAKYIITSDGFRGSNRRTIPYEEQHGIADSQTTTNEPITRKRPRQD